MKKTAWIVIVCVLMSNVAWAQQGTGAVETKPAHPVMGMIGVVMAVTGIVMMAPRGEEYHILGESYCVSFDYRTVDSGGCSRGPTTRQVGLILFGVGVPLTYFGLWKQKTVLVNPQISKSGVGAAITVKWGGKK